MAALVQAFHFRSIGEGRFILEMPATAAMPNLIACSAKSKLWSCRWNAFRYKLPESELMSFAVRISS
ncbi:MAG: hypothetical protein DME86_10000, partial [Verrucomicrobia bacterium]